MKMLQVHEPTEYNEVFLFNAHLGGGFQDVFFSQIFTPHVPEFLYNHTVNGYPALSNSMVLIGYGCIRVEYTS